MIMVEKALNSTRNKNRLLKKTFKSKVFSKNSKFLCLCTYETLKILKVL